MKSPRLVILILTTFLISGLFAACGTRSNRVLLDEQTKPAQNESAQTYSRARAETAEATRTEGDDYSLKAGYQSPVAPPVSLQQANQSYSVAEAMDRKIIRNADLTLEVGAPADAQRKIATIAEMFGGFVVTSESKLLQVGDSKQVSEVNLVVRVPALQFGVALDQIRNAGNRVIQERLSGQDVTEEFIDLEARVKTQKALESQFLEIMKQAHKVPDALEVQRQIADVRTEIEKLEGRKRFLENRASLSTISVNLQSPAAIAVSTSGFGRSVKEAVVDGVDVASAIVLFLIRFLIVMIPVTLLVILPGWLLARAGLRRTSKMQLKRATANSSSDEAAD